MITYGDYINQLWRNTEMMDTPTILERLLEVTPGLKEKVLTDKKYENLTLEEVLDMFVDEKRILEDLYDLFNLIKKCFYIRGLAEIAARENGYTPVMIENIKAANGQLIEIESLVDDALYMIHIVNICKEYYREAFESLHKSTK